jgi:signal transduction histidine kinase/ligand-binding sensor domain-containing protein
MRVTLGPMLNPKWRGRHAALRLAVAGLRTVQLSILLAGVLLACCPRASALDPSLDISQYAHTAWKVREGFPRGLINSIAQPPDGYLWLGTEFGLLRFDGVRAVSWQPPADQHLPSSNILSLLAARDGTLWIGTRKGLASWKDGKLTQYPELAGLYVAKLLEDREGRVWAGGFAYTPPGKLCAFQNGSAQCYGEDGALGNGVLGLYEDTKGNLWAGVRTGLWRWKPGPPKFYPLPGEQYGIQGLAEGDDSALLIATHSGIRRLVDGKTEPYPLPGTAQQFQTYRLLRDRDGGLWIGTLAQGLVHVHHGRTDVFTQTDSLSGDVNSALFEDREGNMWVATTNGLDRFRDFAVALFSANQGLPNGSGRSVLAARDGGVWLDTNDGLSRWNNGQIKIYHERSSQVAESNPGAVGRVQEISVNRFPKPGLLSLFQDDRGRIWVAANSGVGYLENDQFISLNGVPGGIVYSIAEDTRGNLWIANLDHGLFQLLGGNVVRQIPWAKLGGKDFATALAADPLQGGLWLGFSQKGLAYFTDGQIRASYTSDDGLGEGRVNDLRLDPDGTLWAATEGGLSRLKNRRLATLTSKSGLPCDAVNWVMEDDAHSLWLNMPCGLVRIERSQLDAWGAAVDAESASKDEYPKRTTQFTVFDSSDGVPSSAYIGSSSPTVAKSSDGKLWFTTLEGFSVLDPRHLPYNRLPPPVHIEQITVDRKTSFDVTGNTTGHLRLPPLVRDLEIDYTALSFVAPEKNRFRVKLEGWDRDWQDVGARRQAFYSNLPPRKYRFRVIACNNSGVWNEAGTFLDFAVAPAYYQTLWFRLTLVAAFLAVLWGLYQLRVRQLARQFNMRMEARVTERTRIARELHDSLLQGFQGLMFRLQAVRDMLPGRAPAEAIEALDVALERGDKAIAEGRDTVSDLREPIMGDSDIAQALTALGKELALQSGNGSVPCVRVLVEGKQRELNPMLRDEIYRIGREALRNAFLHARAQKIEAEITYSDSEFLLHVRDDGGGIDPEVANQGTRAGHWGLPGMRERAKSFGGKLEVWSEHGAGTEIKLRVPGAIAYGKSEPRRRFWSWRNKIGESDGQQS